MTESQPIDKCKRVPEFDRMWNNLGMDTFVPLELLEGRIASRREELSRQSSKPVAHCHAFADLLGESGIAPLPGALLMARYYRLIPDLQLIGDEK